MKDHAVDKVNRRALQIIGIILVLVGIAAILQSSGAFGSQRADSPILAEPTIAWYLANGAWVWPVVIGALLVIAGLAIWWVSAQFRLRGSTRIDLVRSEQGALTASAHHLAVCVERDALAQDDIARARARITASEEAIDVWLTVWVGPPYDVGRAVARVANTVLPNLRAALDAPQSRPIHTHINVESAEAAMSRLE